MQHALNTNDNGDIDTTTSSSSTRRILEGTDENFSITSIADTEIATSADSSLSPCTPPYSPPSSPTNRTISRDTFRHLSNSDDSDVEEVAEVESFLVDTDELTEDSGISKILIPFEDNDQTLVDPETQARLELILKAAGGDGKQFADADVLRRLTSSVSCALDEAAAALMKMRDNKQRTKQALVEACMQGDVPVVKALLRQGMSISETSDDGESLLTLACHGGHYELTQLLLSKNASVEDRGSKGDCTPLMEAASAGYADIVRLLIAHGAEVNAQSATGNTPLMYACSGGHDATVQVLLDAGANVEEHNENGHTPLMEAASAGHVQVAQLLLERGAGINAHSNEFKESALTLACYKGHLDMVNFLLKAGADQEHKTDEMHTALMEASMDGHVDVARLLLDSGAQVNMPQDSFESPLTLAACGGHVDLAMLLLERGANIEEVNDEGYTPLMEASREGHEDMVSLLLDRGAMINAQTEETQETALTLACCGGFLEVVDYLVKRGANMELGASTALMEAAQEGHMEVVRYLLQAGANVHARTLTHDTALTYACENGHTDVAEVLLTYGADLEAQAEGGRTPLMKACRAGHLCTVQYLVSKGANLNHQTTNNDHTPLSLACAGGHLSIVQFLLDQKADLFHKLKDNSTMLMEASKGGHLSVVRLLLDYPNATVVNNSVVVSTSEAAALTAPASCIQTDELDDKDNEEKKDGESGVGSSNGSADGSTSSDTNGSDGVIVSSSVEGNSPTAEISSAATEGVSGETAGVTNTTETGVTKTNETDGVKTTSQVKVKSVEKMNADAAAEKMSGNPEQSDAEQNQQQTTQEKQPDESQQQQQTPQQQLPTQPSTSSGNEILSAKKRLVALMEERFSERKSVITAVLTSPDDDKDAMENNEQTDTYMYIAGSTTGTALQKFSSSEFKVLENMLKKSRAMPSPADDEYLFDQLRRDFPQDVTASINVPPVPEFANGPLSLRLGVDTGMPVKNILKNFSDTDEGPKAKHAKKDMKAIGIQCGNGLALSLTKKPANYGTSVQQQHQMQQQQCYVLQQHQQYTQAYPTEGKQQIVMPQPQYRTLTSEQELVFQYNPQQQQQQLQTHLKQSVQLKQQLEREIMLARQELHQHHREQLTQQNMTFLERNGTCTRISQEHSSTVNKTNSVDNLDMSDKAIMKELTSVQKELSGTSTNDAEPDLLSVMLMNDVGLVRAEHSDGTIATTYVNTNVKSYSYVSPGTNISQYTGMSDQRNLVGYVSVGTDGGINWTKYSDNHVGQQVAVGGQNGGLVEVSVPAQQVEGDVQQETVTRDTDSLLCMMQQRQQQQLQELPPIADMHQHLMQGQQCQGPLHRQQQQQPQPQQYHQQQNLQQHVVPLNHLLQKQLTENVAHQSRRLKYGPQTPLSTVGKNQLQVRLADLRKYNGQNPNPTVNTNPTTQKQPVNNVKQTGGNPKTETPATSTTSNQNAVAASMIGTTTYSEKKSSAPLIRGKKAKSTSNQQQRVPVIGSSNTGTIHGPTKTTSTSSSSNNNNNNSTQAMEIDCKTESNSDTALTLACAGGHDELVELLLGKGANIEHKDKKGFTPLALASTAGHEKVVEVLLNRNANMEAVSERTRDTPLSLACSGGRYEVAELLLKRGANKEHRNISDYTPLSLAASGGYVNIIRLLLQYGAEINSRTGSKLGISPLMLASMNGHTAAVKLLLDMGGDINAQIETNRNTALTLACFQGRHEVVALLLERKANVEHRAKTGLTPLMEAASGGYVDVGRVLIDKGAEVNAPPVPSSRDTALTIASDKGHVRFVELLLTHNAQVEVKNKKGNSPLWLAANGGHLAVVELLHSVGADIDSQDNRRVSCLMAAFRKGHTKVVKWMVNHVTQFPSDKEMTRYLGSISDKDLLQKCGDCMDIILKAKEQQAAKANKCASILLEEIDLEKLREESKKAAAARRKERKRKKKLEKKGGTVDRKKKGQNKIRDEDEDDDTGSEDEAEDEDEEEERESEVEEEEEVVQKYAPVENAKNKKDKAKGKKGQLSEQPRRGNIEQEEGDSGIDASSQGSCSSNEKVVARETGKDKNKSKKQRDNSTVAASKKLNRERSSSANTSNQASVNKTKEKKNTAQTQQPTTAGGKQQDQNTTSSKKKERAPSTSAKPQPSSAKSEKSSTPSPTPGSNKGATTSTNQTEKDNNKKGAQKSKSGQIPKQASNDRTDAKKSPNENLWDGRKEERGKKSSSSSVADSTESVSFPETCSVSSACNSGLTVAGGVTGNPVSSPAKREDGWKEVVVKKCTNSTYRPKKVSVPLNAISRVIGRGGGNINAIRTVTGAHIEVEKQCKGQGERIITMKGSAEATKQAHMLITALIEDPEADIMQLLPKNVRMSSTVWEKSSTTTAARNKGISSNTYNASVSGRPASALSTTHPQQNHQHTVQTSQVTHVTPQTTAPVLSKPAFSSHLVPSSPAAPSFASLARAPMTINRGAAPRVLNSATYEKKPTPSLTSIPQNTGLVTPTPVTNPASSAVSTTNKGPTSSTSAVVATALKGPKTVSTVSKTSSATVTSAAPTFAAKLTEQLPSAPKDVPPPFPVSSASITIARTTVISTSSSVPLISSSLSGLNKPPFPSATVPFSTAPPFSQFATQQPSTSSSANAVASSHSQQHQQLSTSATMSIASSNTPLLSTVTSVTTVNTVVTVISTTTTTVQVTSVATTATTVITTSVSTINTALEYSLFSDTFPKVRQHTIWGGDDNGDSNNNSKIFSFTGSGSALGSCSVSPNFASSFIDYEPPIQVDASKAPGYRGSTSSGSPSVTKSSSSSASVSPNPLSYAGAGVRSETSSFSALSRPSTVISSSVSSHHHHHSFTPRVLFPDKPSFPARDPINESFNPNIMSSGPKTGGVKFPPHSAIIPDSMGMMSTPFYSATSYSQPQVSTNVSMSRLNPRAPDFSAQSVKSSVPFSNAHLQAHQSLTPGFNQSQLPPFASGPQLHSSIPQANVGNVGGYNAGKYAHQQIHSQPNLQHPQQQQRLNPPPWMLMNQNQTFPQQDALNFCPPTTVIGNLLQNHGDLLTGLDSGSTGALNMQQNMEERRIPPRPIGTERAWRAERDRCPPPILDQDISGSSWMADQKLPWSSNNFRANHPSQASNFNIGGGVQQQQAQQSLGGLNQFSRIPPLSDDMRPPPILDSLYQNDQYSGLLGNVGISQQMPSLLPPMNMAPTGSASSMISHDLSHHRDTFKLDPSWDPNRLSIPDILPDTTPQHHMPSSNWNAQWNQRNDSTY